jgi:hypothetical protein
VPGGDGLVECGAVGRDLVHDARLLLGELGGLLLELLRVPARRGRRLDRLLGVADPLDRERLGAADALLDALEREERLLGPGEGREVLAQGRLERRLPLARRLALRLDLLLAGHEQGLVGELLVQRGPSGHEVVGHEAGPGVAHRRLDAGGPACHLGLAPERLELAADLAEQVAQPGQVALAGVELAERLLLALAVLEDAGGLLDEAAAVLRRRVEDRVELALADDDVHLAPDAGVREQLLDVEQPARGAVDGVLRPAGAEHRPADRDLGVLDRQRPVRVVDRQDDLGAAERRAARRAGEDDVVHLAAPQGLRAGLAHHPGEGVDDVGLARAVGPHDARDPRLELQRRRGREGLEALQREALEVQRGSLGGRQESRWNGRAAAGEASPPTLTGTPPEPMHPGASWTACQRAVSFTGYPVKLTLPRCNLSGPA